MKNPFLVGDKIYLSALTKDDITDRYINWLNDKETTSRNSHGSFPYTFNKASAYIESSEKSNTMIVFAVRLKSNDLHIGNISLSNINWISRSAEIALLIGDKKYRSKGVGTEMMRLVLEYGFDTLNLNRIYGGAPVEHEGAVGICINNRMTKEGYFREVLYKNGKYLDALFYAMLRKDYEKMKNEIGVKKDSAKKNLRKK